MLGELFDPKSELHVYEHCRPHWSQAGSVVFITFRTHDSIPREVIERWDREKQDWLQHRGYNAEAHWTVLVEKLSEKDREDFNRTFERTRELFLDSCHGRCVLKR